MQAQRGADVAQCFGPQLVDFNFRRKRRKGGGEFTEGVSSTLLERADGRVDLAGQTTCKRHERGDEGDDQRGEFAADDDDQPEQGKAADVVLGAVQEKIVGSGEQVVGHGFME